MQYLIYNLFFIVFLQLFTLLQKVLYLLIYLLSILLYILQQKFIMYCLKLKNINFPERRYIRKFILKLENVTASINNEINIADRSSRSCSKRTE